MQEIKYRIIGILIAIVCIVVIGVIILDSKDRLKKVKGREKIGTLIDIILDILDWYQLVIVIIIGLVIGITLIIYG